jgi:kumamolisin
VQIGGTSVSCPVWAGFLSTINAALNWSGMGNLGFFNQYFYSMGIPKGYSTPYEFCYQITSGSNGSPPSYPGYDACVDYNLCTGNGSIWGGELATALMTYGTQPGTPPGAFNLTIDGKAKATSVKVSWTPSSGAKGYVIQLLTNVPNGNLAETILLPPDYKSFTFGNLTPNTQDAVQVFAYNASGSYAPVVEFITPKK